MRPQRTTITAPFRFDPDGRELYITGRVYLGRFPVVSDRHVYDARTDEEIDELPSYALEQVDEALITEAKAIWEKE